jgi:hypothetical protein
MLSLRLMAWKSEPELVEVGSSSSSGRRHHSEYSLGMAVTGSTAWARRIVRTQAGWAGRRAPSHAASRVHHGFDAGVPRREVHLAAHHADPRTTTVYDRRRQDFDHHAAYVVVAFVAGG